MTAEPTDNKLILIVDDEPDVQTLVGSNLRNAGFNVVAAANGAVAIEKARKENPALVVLDLMLPGLSGLEVCKILKGSADTSHLPVIMLTAKVEEVDRIVGFELGADDYVTKPFSPRELVLRIKSVLRRSRGTDVDGQVVKVGPLSVDRARHLVRVRGKAVDLTATEFRLLSLLVERRGRVQRRDALLHDVWAYEGDIDTRTVDTHVRRLREKLGVAGHCIETVRGFGYKVSEEGRSE